MKRWQQWVDPRVTAGDRWHSSRVGLIRSSCVLGDHLVSALRELARSADDDMSLARTGQFLQKKLREFENENRLLQQLADTGRVILLLQRTILSVLGVLDRLENPVREIWERNLESERTEWTLEVEKVLADEDKMKREMGDEKQQVQILALLRHELDQFGHILTSRELDLVARVFDVVAQRGGVVVGRLPTWFATSELEWFRAKTTIVEGGEEVCVRQAAVWAKLHHPNVRKFFGACHVGEAFVIHEASNALPLPKQNVPRRRTRKSRGERAVNKKRSKSEKRALQKAAQTWEYVLGCALGLQYVHDRGLVHEQLSVGHLLYSQASQKGILSGMGLTRWLENVGRDSQELHLGPSVASDILAFGLAIFEILVRDRSPEAADVAFVESLPDIRPDFINEAEWDLLAGMCASDPGERPCMADIVHEISVLARPNAPSPKDPTNASIATVNVSKYEIQTLGMTLEATLEEIKQLCEEEDGTSCGGVNRPVYDRLVDIYQQLLGSPALATMTLVESFSLVVLRLFDLLDQNTWGSMSVAASMCASRTVAGKNYSLHHEIDSLLRTSGLQNTAPVHCWQGSWKENWRRQDNMLASCMENPDALLNQLSSPVDRSEAVALLQFESNTHSGENPRSLEISNSFDDNEELPLWFIPPYQVQLGSHIADGSFGAVYEGEWLDTDVVVKQVLLEQTDHETWAQFRREADLWFSLNHPNLIKLYGACHQGRPFFVCEPAGHGTLASYLKGKSRRNIWFAIGDAALGLQHLHDHEIVHGDLKGNNILVCDSVDGLPMAKLADFGLSVVTNRAAPPVNDESEALGAFRWKAPECLQGMPPTFTSDIYSFGMCIIEAITGEYPWGCTMPDSVVVRNVVGERLLPPRPDCFNDDEWQLVSRMCRYEPQLRIPIGAVINCAFNLASHQ